MEKFTSDSCRKFISRLRGVYQKTEVAIKQVHSKVFTEKLMEDFIAEAELMNKIPPHPHVVSI